LTGETFGIIETHGGVPRDIELFVSPLLWGGFYRTESARNYPLHF
jgi:hypothetical protein